MFREMRLPITTLQPNPFLKNVSNMRQQILILLLDPFLKIVSQNECANTLQLNPCLKNVSRYETAITYFATTSIV